MARRQTLLGKAIAQTERDITVRRTQADGEIAVLEGVLAKLKQQQAATERRRAPVAENTIPHKAEL